MRPEDDTQPVTPRSQQELVQSSYELHLRRSQATRVIPLHRSEVEVELGEGLTVRVHFHAGKVTFQVPKTTRSLYKDGRPVTSGQLEVGSFLECEGARLLLWDNGASAAYLKGYSAPYAGDLWPLPEGSHSVGRGGRRHNAVQLDHPTVSREHATFVCTGGRYRLVAESSTNPVYVGGTALSPGGSIDLNPGDLIEIGELVFRFHWHGAPESQPSSALIAVRSLGGLQVKVGTQAIADKDWKTQQIKWMFAHLAYQWGKPLATEALMEELWPDFPLEKGRNNLNYSLSVLRQTLRSLLPEGQGRQEVVLRSSSTLQLNPDVLDEHDVVTVSRALEGLQRLSGEDWAGRAAQAVLRYSGPFLSECYLDWAEPVRQSLEVEVLDVAKRYLEFQAARNAWAEIVPLANHALKIDPCSSWAALHLMQAYRHSGSPAEALRCFERHKQTLRKELDAEPGVELLREQLLVSALL